MDSSNISEDGASERVRFDSTVCYVLDNNKKEYLETVSRNSIIYRTMNYVLIVMTIVGYK